MADNAKWMSNVFSTLIKTDENMKLYELYIKYSIINVIFSIGCSLMQVEFIRHILSIIIGDIIKYNNIGNVANVKTLFTINNFGK
ncbi:hypothetical protein GCM10007938_18620 [Vibrio zhanjiangensis]|uniref:Uncharacterized protein n=1 Tax=Vibrio zhanjiangensis TaxID=1046128 RepID=A0ABQ6EYN6_9VIBR|nr:hypothetical protein GCM10007938_18620 [Vibrio zhanjiangensis]